MSGQWETARHCHMALSLLSTKVGQGEVDTDRLSHSHSYAMNTPRDVSTVSFDHSRMGRKRRLPESDVDTPRYPEPQSLSSPPETSRPSQPEFDATPRTSQCPVPEETSPGEPYLEMDSLDPNQLHGGSNFDLNMVDLLQGANFDSLFDMVGQQYPSF